MRKKYNQIGRSMVEMLGVLAIIGVLSVGGITGYSKAMEKYKLNKQTEQLSHLYDVFIRYKAEWKFDEQHVQIVPYFKKMGEIPEEMIVENDDTILYDAFGNEVYIVTNNCTPICKTVLISVRLSKVRNFEICHNIVNLAKQYSDTVHSLYVGKHTADSASEQFGIRWYGNKYCGGANQTCLKDVDNDTIAEMCEFCTDSTICRFRFEAYIDD
ncbi:MAG: type II secretion system protein [Alphaproteobacteria bacterium]|nr:type II secretion system protein [Alphaproteobacteria bacterium]